jgi:hypothetical protein
MRTKPVTRNEVRISVERFWEAVPANAFRKDKERGWGMEAIPELWEPLLKELERINDAYHESEGFKRLQALGLYGPAEDYPSATLPEAHSWRLKSCSRCRRKFYRVGRHAGNFCSDHCATEAAKPALKRKIARQTAARSKKREAARAGRSCSTCGTPMTAQRATKRYCSERCRVAAYRKAALRP